MGARIVATSGYRALLARFPASPLAPFPVAGLSAEQAVRHRRALLNGCEDLRRDPGGVPVAPVSAALRDDQHARMFGVNAPSGGPPLPGIVEQGEIAFVVGDEDAALPVGGQQLLVVGRSFQADITSGHRMVAGPAQYVDHAPRNVVVQVEGGQGAAKRRLASAEHR